MSSDLDDLKSQVQALTNEQCNKFCFLANLDRRGGAGAKQNRILSLVSGPASRQRPNWLQFFLAAVDAGCGDDDELDYDPIAGGHDELLADYGNTFAQLPVAAAGGAGGS